MTEPSHAVFLSYASQDAQAAQKIAKALRAAGIEVWFDQSELRGGDVWDQMIRKQIKACALFIPVISHHTHERREGYFRLEWKLAVDRSNLISATQAFLLPVVIDDTREDDEEIPEKIREIHWTRLPSGETPIAFVDRVQRLLSGEASTAPRGPASAHSRAVDTVGASVQGAWSPKRGLLAAAAVVVLGAVAYVAIEKLWISKPSLSSPTVAATAAPAVFSPPPHSIAVLPFVNMSGDKEQEYFSDGLTEELLNALTEVEGLQVAGRTSSFYFKGKDVDLDTVAHKLNVGAVLEGSVRRSGSTVRVTTQLVNAVTGFHLWSHTYDRNLGDILKLQTEIADAVASALKVSLLGDVATKIELGGTRNPAALDAYLRAMKAHFTAHNQKTDQPAAIAAYSESIRLDPNYALAFAGRAMSLRDYSLSVTGQARHDAYEKALADAQQAIALAPDLAEAHLALAVLSHGSLDFAQAVPEFKRALDLAPGNARVLRDYGIFAVYMGWTEAGLDALRRARVLDPLSRDVHLFLGGALQSLGRYDESTAALRETLKIDPENSLLYVTIGLNFFMLGDFQTALSWCKAKPGEQISVCLALIYDKMGRYDDAKSALAEFTASSGDVFPYVVALIYAQWGNTAKALEWLEKAMQVRDPTLEQMKIDPFLDPLRKEPRFQAIEKALKFPK